MWRRWQVIMRDLVTIGERYLRQAGKRLTPQRRLLLRVLDQAEGHLDAKAIFERGQRLDPRLSLSTVYRTLAALKDMGLVRELHLDEEHHHYELDGKDGHSHLVCLGCGRVVELDSKSFAEAAQSEAAVHGFQVANAQVELTGYCTHCRVQAEM